MEQLVLQSLMVIGTAAAVVGLSEFVKRVCRELLAR